MFSQLTAPTWAEINLDNIRLNFKNIKKYISENTKICAVVKANAYGHGSIMISKTLEDLNVDYLAVSRLEEAIELRKNNIKTPIICLGYIPDESVKYAVESNITITVYSKEMAINISEISKKLGKIAKIHIKVDTGMSRIGFLCNESSVDDILFINNLQNIDIEGIYTHFATADEEDKAFTIRQVSEFKNIIKLLEKSGIYIPIKHTSNSAGIIDIKEAEFDMVRCGIILYGHYPSEEVNKSNLYIKPAMTLKTKISNIQDHNEGVGISYGLKYKTTHKEKIVTLPIGYADGFTRMQNNPKVSIQGELFDVVGRICMDQCMVRIDRKIDVKVGDEVVIFGEGNGNNIERIANDLNTINYEVLCMVSRRVDRVYLEGNAILQVDSYLVK